ncbi:hypothetical protein DFJ74DRAFT_85252 [Hyaloraphidium curvatum]|nr:hypothetical protein DFJ74DRAFT_85252 [Hyaloraphidium curvatum]
MLSAQPSSAEDRIVAHIASLPSGRPAQAAELRPLLDTQLAPGHTADDPLPALLADLVAQGRLFVVRSPLIPHAWADSEPQSGGARARKAGEALLAPEAAPRGRSRHAGRPGDPFGAYRGQGEAARGAQVPPPRRNLLPHRRPLLRPRLLRRRRARPRARAAPRPPGPLLRPAGPRRRLQGLHKKAARVQRDEGSGTGAAGAAGDGGADHDEGHVRAVRARSGRLMGRDGGSASTRAGRMARAGGSAAMGKGGRSTRHGTKMREPKMRESKPVLSHVHGGR